MLKKFGYCCIVASVVTFHAGMAGTIFTNSAIAEEQRCKKCGHFPSKPFDNCSCSCHGGKK